MVATKVFTAEDLARMETDEPWELWEGELRKVPGAGLEASEIAGWLFSLVFAFVRPRNMGVVTGSDGTYILSRNPDIVVVPDVAFVSWKRLPGGVRPKGFAPVAPDFAIEVASPSDGPRIVAEKTGRYRDAGVRLVWWVYPANRTVDVYRNGQLVATLKVGDTLDGEDVLPGFTVAVRDAFC
jgi:Uma2 family endonuclease